MTYLLNKDTSPYPATLDVDFYRNRYRDLASLSDEDLKAHYIKYGLSEGRQPNCLAKKSDFLSLIDSKNDVLEIGPFCNPMIEGEGVKYFDVLSKDGLEKRASAIGKISAKAPHIDYVSPTADLSIINEKFKFIVSSHCIEHQPDLILHMLHVERMLDPGGRYFIAIPDKRYCFDQFLPASTIADVLDAHWSKRRVHTLKCVIEHAALTTHNGAQRHWEGDHGKNVGVDYARVQNALLKFDQSKGGYIDVHAWQFTPDSAFNLFTTLNELNIINIMIERIYPTRRYSNEFWIIMRRNSS